MFSLLCEGSGSGNLGWTIALIVLIVLMVIYLIFGTINRKKQQEEAMKMLNDLKVGDKVVTNAGVYGEIVSQKETNMGKIVVLKTGEEGGKASFITINASVILGIDQKEDLILDEQGNVIEPEAAKEQVMKKTASDEKKDTKDASQENTDAKDQEDSNKVNEEEKKEEGLADRVRKKTRKKDK